MKESRRWLGKKRKKLLKTIFVVAFCGLCGIMYTNRHSVDVEDIIGVQADDLRFEQAEERIAKPEKRELSSTMINYNSSANVEEKTVPVEELQEAQEKTVPAEESQEVQEADADRKEAEASEGRVDINTAGIDALKSLSGIGDVKARAVIAYREEHGAFAKTEDIMKVPGIGEATYKKLRDLIKV